MKILLTSTLYPTPGAAKIVGGAEIFARRFAEGLVQRGDEVEVIRAQSKPDVLHSNNLSGLSTAVWRVAAQLGVPILHTIHDYYLTCPRCSRFHKGRSCEGTCTSCGILTYHR